MPLKLSRHPVEVEEFAAKGVTSLLAHPEQSAPVFGEGFTAAEVTMAAPHLAFSIGLEALLGGEGIAAARPFARRFLLLSGDEAVGSVDVTPVEGDAPLSLSRIGSSALDGAFLAELRLAQEREASGEAEVEPRVLVLPSIYQAALWLHGPVERLVPLLPESEELAAGQPYEWPDLEPVLQQLAEARDELPGPES